MTINTGVSANLRNPQTFHNFSYSFAVPGLTSLLLRVALIGAKTPAGTAVAGTVYQINDPQEADTLFGLGGELTLMCRKGFETAKRLGRGPKMFAVCMAESSGVANVKTITGTGAATAEGNIVIRIAGRTLTVGVRVADSANTIAAAINSAILANGENMPVLATVAANVVTLTHRTKGVNGVDVQVTVEQQVAGNAQAVANTVAGTGVTDHQAALDALSPLPFDGIAFANHAAADITEINADIAQRWSYSEKKWRWYCLGEPGTIGTATALATAANHQAVLIASMEGCLSTAGEMAAAFAFGLFSRERPNAIYNGMKLPLYPPPAATVYTGTEIETAIAAGLTPLTAVVDPFTNTVTADVAKIVRATTTKTTVGASPFVVLADLGVSRTGVAIAQQIDVAYDQRFSGDADPDGSYLTDDTIGQVKDMIENILRIYQDSRVLRNVEDDLVGLKCERSATPGRLDNEIPYTVVLGLHQVANIHRVQI